MERIVNLACLWISRKQEHAMSFAFTLAKISVLTLVFSSVSLNAQAPETESSKADAPDRGVFAGDWLTIGIGGGYGPSYEGSDDYTLFPAPLAQGSVSGFDFGARGPGLYVDLVRDTNANGNVKFLAGPLVRVRTDRNNNIKDSVVRSLGKKDVAIEIGATAGVSFSKVLNRFDSLTLSTDIQWDVAEAHRGRLISPNISYSTPLSTAVFTSLSLSATHVDGNYADTYFSIDAAGSAASGLPTFDAKGGWKSYGASLLGGVDLSGDARDGGWGVFGLVSYSKLIGDAKRSPVTSIRGDADQWFLAGGISYTF
ncbi:MipA/OmpV family protein [Sphingorhabdus sp. IMCC26285]|uniref:MipA/OmpV family protein n=2 Tax=Sphingorhabdus profundilacus TaxID=2509718 RepID=A0A6I4LW67_9SPHN|nr:MipA/OmpV family protein [Sphingorhabdus profundilacus]